MNLFWGFIVICCGVVLADVQYVRLDDIKTLVFESGKITAGILFERMPQMIQVGGPYVPVSRILCNRIVWDGWDWIWECHLPDDVSATLVDSNIICELYNMYGVQKVLDKSCRVEYSLKPIIQQQVQLPTEANNRHTKKIIDNGFLIPTLYFMDYNVALLAHVGILIIPALMVCVAVCIFIWDAFYIISVKISMFFRRLRLRRFVLKTQIKIQRRFFSKKELSVSEHALIVLMPHMSFETLNSLVGVSDIITVAATCMIRRKILQQGCLRLNGRIKHFPPSIGQLSSLKELSLSECKNLTSIPDTLAGLTSLEKLDLSKSSIASLPPWIGQLSSLKELSLSECKNLTSIPDTLAGLTSLENLDLSSSSIASLPPSIGQLSSLKELSLRECRNLISIPGTLSGLASLENLDLSYTSIASLSPWIGQLSSLKKLSLIGCNNLRSIPDMLAGLTSLENMNLSGLWIKSLPPSIGQLSSLKVLTLCVCTQLTSIPDSLLGLTSLEKMNLSWTSIQSLPPWIGQLSSLKELSLYLCRKLTSIPDTFAGLTSLEKMDLSYTSIASLPPSIRQLSSLKELSLRGCEKLTSIPYALAMLPHLEEIHIENTYIEWPPVNRPNPFADHVVRYE